MLLHIILELVSKIDTFVREGVTDTREMEWLLKIIVQTEIFKNENIPEPTNKRFFPTNFYCTQSCCSCKKKIMSLSNGPRMFCERQQINR